MKNNLIILFVKYPEKGKVKTRLNKYFDEKIVLEIYKSLILDIIKILKSTKITANIFCYPPKSLIKFKNWLRNDLKYVKQKGNNLGERMKNSFLDSFKLNYKKVILIGSDIPGINKNILNYSFRQLDFFDVVIGPTFDGGYYLIGFNDYKFLSVFFNNINWGANDVFEETVKKLEKRKYKTKILKKLLDIDEFDDLKRYYKKNKLKFIKNNIDKYLHKLKKCKII